MPAAARQTSSLPSWSAIFSAMSHIICWLVTSAVAYSILDGLGRVHKRVDKDFSSKKIDGAKLREFILAISDPYHLAVKSDGLALRQPPYPCRCRNKFADTKFMISSE